MLFLLPQAVLGDPSSDCKVSGSLKIDGQNAPSGSLVEAWINGEMIVSVHTTKSGEYSLTIPQYDPNDSDTKGYHSTSDIVTVKVNQREAQPTFNPEPGSMTKNLEVKTALNVKLTTWGKIKALFK
jgi:hypothetical protein